MALGSLCAFVLIGRKVIKRVGTDNVEFEEITRIYEFLSLYIPLYENEDLRRSFEQWRNGYDVRTIRITASAKLNEFEGDKVEKLKKLPWYLANNKKLTQLPECIKNARDAIGNYFESDNKNDDLNALKEMRTALEPLQERFGHPKVDITKNEELKSRLKNFASNVDKLHRLSLEFREGANLPDIATYCEHLALINA